MEVSFAGRPKATPPDHNGNAGKSSIGGEANFSEEIATNFGKFPFHTSLGSAALNLSAHLVKAGAEDKEMTAKRDLLAKHVQGNFSPIWSILVLALNN